MSHASGKPRPRGRSFKVRFATTQGPLTKDQQVKIDSLDDLVEFFITAGKKGIAVNRYKGLGEMNPDQLWETTMDPTTRTLLQVTMDDAVLADQIFSTLMGDNVDPRREFIEANARFVSNLDV